MVSEDVDFLASAKIANQISTAWGAEIQLPGWDDFTPNTAVVYLEFAGGRRSIDFLDAVPGIGPTKRRRLLMHFGSIEAIKGASLEELIAVQGITQADAEMLKSQLA